jgi:hypothetical protein
MEQRVGERSADSLVKENEHQRDPGSLIGELVQIAPSMPSQQAVGFHLAEVVTELSKSVRVCRKTEACDDGVMDIGRPPSVELGAVVC